MKEVDVSIAYKLLANSPVILISSAFEGKLDVMTNAWNCPLDFNPSKVLCVISSGSSTRKTIEKSGEFIINVPSYEQKGLVLSVGSVHGSEVDKFATYDIHYTLGTVVQAPCIAGSLAYLECKLISEPEFAAKHDVLIAEVLKAYAREDYFDGQRINPSSSYARTLHHIDGAVFNLPGTIIK